jgi:outer membrane protein TolC
MEHFKKYVLSGILLLGAIARLNAQQPSRNLDYFFNEAVRRSPLLTELNNQLQSGRIDSMRIKAGYLPQVSASSSGMYAPIIKGYGYDEVITNGQALDALLNVNYNLAGKRNVNNQLAAIHLQSDSLRLATRLSILDLKRSIADQYITTFSSQQQVTFNLEIYLLLSKEEQLLKKLTQANVYKQVDYLTFLVTFQQQQLQLRQAELQLKSDYSTLNYLAGIVDTIAQHLEDPDLQAATIATDKNIFFRKLGLDSARIENRKDAIAFLYKPRLSLYANSGFNSSLAFQPYRNFGASAGFTVSVPIYDGRQKQLQYAQLAIEQQTQFAYKEFFHSQHTQQLNLLRQQIDDQRALYEKIGAQLKFSKSLIEVDSRLLQTGDIRVTDFVIAINNYLAAQNLLRQTHINRLKLLNQLNYWNR